VVDGRAAVGSVLLFIQAALGILATLGMVVIMHGRMVYAVFPMLHVALLLVIASGVARGWRWTWWAAVVVESLSLTGYLVNLWLGLLPQVDVTLTLVGLLTTVGLPVAVLWQAVRLLEADLCAT
jgi:hypothetical protein